MGRSAEGLIEPEDRAELAGMAGRRQDQAGHRPGDHHPRPTCRRGCPLGARCRQQPAREPGRPGHRHQRPRRDRGARGTDPARVPGTAAGIGGRGGDRHGPGRADPALERRRRAAYGWSADEAIGQLVHELVPPIDPDLPRRTSERLRRGRSWSGELEVRRRDGSVVPVQAFDRPVLDERGRITALIGTSFDVTAQRRAEHDALARADEHATVATLSQQVLRTRDLDALLTEAADAVREGLDTDIARALIRSPSNGALIVRAASGSDRLAVGHELESDEAPLAASVLDDRRTIAVADLASSAQRSHVAEDDDAASGMAAVIECQGVAEGALLVLSRAARQFTSEEIDFLQSVANLVSAALEAERSEERLQHLALHDPLTGLPNRTLFRDRLDQAIRRHERDEHGIAVLFCDLDRFKMVNDASATPSATSSSARWPGGWSSRPPRRHRRPLRWGRVRRALRRRRRARGGARGRPPHHPHARARADRPRGSRGPRQPEHRRRRLRRRRMHRRGAAPQRRRRHVPGQGPRPRPGRAVPERRSRRRCSSASRSPPRSARRWLGASSCCVTSPRCSSTAPPSGSRRCSAGSTRRAASSTRASSCPSPRRPARSPPSANGRCVGRWPTSPAGEPRPPRTRRRASR